MATCCNIYIGVMFIYACIYGSRSDSLYSIMANMSLTEFTLQGKPTQRVAQPESILGLRTDTGLTCYDAIHYRYYYLYQNITNISSSVGIASYDLFNNVSLNSIELNDHFRIYSGLENAFLLSCNPNNGDLYVFGTSILDGKIIHLYHISFIDPPDSSPYSKQLTYNMTEIATYYAFNQLLNDNYIDQPHIFDAVTNSIWFAHYFGDYISSNNWIWYHINVLDGKILQQNEVVHFPNFTYLDYDRNRNKIIGAKLDIVDYTGELTVKLYNTNDFSIYHSYGVINDFYPCNSITGVSSIDFENNIWYIVNKEFNIQTLSCDKTVISYLDLNQNNRNITYINSSSSNIQGGMYSVEKIKYYVVINVSATMNNEIINTTNDKFVSYTIDSSQIVKPIHLNFSDPQLIYLASQLSPSILRAGGTDGDYTYYKVGDENPCHLPVVNGTRPYYCYSIQEFDQLVQFARKTNSSLVFGLSMGYPQIPKNDSSYWNSTNTHQFLRHLHDIRRYTNEDIYGFELGNERSNNPYTIAEPQADAFLKLHAILSEIWSDEMKNDSFYFKLFGFDNFGRTLYGDGNFTYFPTFVNITCPVLTGLTYHVYIGGTDKKELQPEWLDRQYEISNKVSSIFSNASHYNLCADNRDDYDRIRHNVIAGEIAYHGGSSAPEGLLNTYIDGFWYMDTFGLLGNLGHACIFRQTLVNPGYGFLPENNYYMVHPDYFTALLANNLMSNKVIGMYSNQQHLRIYARCLNTKYPMKNIDNILPEQTKNGIVIQYINLFFRVVTIELDINIVVNLQNTTQMYLWSLTSNNETNLESLYMDLNGVKLELNAVHQVPNLNGKLVADIDMQDNKMKIPVPKTSYGFIVFTQTNIDACQ